MEKGGGVIFTLLNPDVTAIRASRATRIDLEIFKSPMEESKSVFWPRTNQQGERVANGIYLYRVVARKEGEILRSKVFKLLITPQRVLAETGSGSSKDNLTLDNKARSLNQGEQKGVPEKFKAAPDHPFSDWKYWMTRKPTKGEIEAAIRNYIKNKVDEKFVFNREKRQLRREDNKKWRAQKASYRKAIEKNIRRKIDIATAPMISQFVYENKVNAHIKQKIHYDKLKAGYSERKTSKNAIKRRYQKAFEMLQIDVKELLQAVLSKSWMEKDQMEKQSTAKSTTTSTAGDGAHHIQLAQNRPGDAMYGSGGSSSSGGSLSASLVGSHAAIWTESGDPYQYNPESAIAMSAWGKEPDPTNPKHERKGVGYDYRNVWASVDEGKIYGLRVQKWQGFLWWGHWEDVPDWKAQDASSYSETLWGKPYDLMTGKWNTDSYTCSKVVWQSWDEQGFDLDAGTFLAGYATDPGGTLVDWTVTPKEIYDDDNIRVLYSFE